MTGKARSGSPPTERVIAIIDLITDRHTPATAAEIADELGLNRSTVGAILGVLTEHGWLYRSSDLRYRPGTRLATLAGSAGKAWNVPNGAEDALHELAEQVGCTAALSLVTRTELTFVAVTAGRGRLPAGITTGTVLPLRAPAGAAVLAFADPVQQHAWLDTSVAQQRDRLAEALQMLRSHGVALFGIDAADPMLLDVLADVVEHLADTGAPARLRERVLSLLAQISGVPYRSGDLDAHTCLPISYLVAPVFDGTGQAQWELQIGPLRPSVDRAERENYIHHLRRIAEKLSASPTGTSSNTATSA